MLVYRKRAIFGLLHALISFLLCSSLSRACGEAITAAPPPESLLVASCEPCRFKIGHTLTTYSIRLKFQDLPNNRRVIEALHIFRDDNPDGMQSLTVHDMAPLRKSDEVLIGTSDINFDGYNDLFFATSRGTANTYADYWLFVPSKQEFKYLGNYPIFSIDKDKHCLFTYERGGYGGMIYIANYYRFVNGILTLVESEKQEETKREGIYQKSIFRLQDGKLRLLKREKVKAPLSE